LFEEQHQLDAWYLKAKDLAAEKVMALLRNGPADPSNWHEASGLLEQPPIYPKLKYRIYFERDYAGLANMRLQFESLVAIAALTGREIVLPPKRWSAHFEEEPFHESRMWSMSTLGEHVGIVLASEFHPPVEAWWLKTNLFETDIYSLPRDRDWYFPAGLSRIQHFECLPLQLEDSRRASQAVFEGLEINPQNQLMTKHLLRNLKLKKGKYVAVHIRRGDFKRFSPGIYKSGKEIAESIVEYTKGQTVLVATDAKPTDRLIEEFRNYSLAKRVVYTFEGFKDEDDVVSRAMMDILACTWANTFIGTKDSTFSLTMMMERTKAYFQNATSDATPRFTLGKQGLFSRGHGTCWNKVTTFDGLL